MRMRATLGKTGAAVVAATLLSGCGLFASGTSFTAGDVTVVDEAGVVREIVATDPPGAAAYADAPSATAPNGRLDEVLVLWIGSGCDGGSVLHLRGNALTLDIAPREATTDPCPALSRAITLRLNRVIDASSITITQGAG